MRKLICMVLCLSLFWGLCGCGRTEYTDPGNFYYYRTDTRYSSADGVIAPEVRELEGLRGDISALLEAYCRGPLSRELANPLPRDTKALGWELTDGALTITLDEDFAQLTGIELTIAAACMSRTFLELTGAETVTITAGGAPLNGRSAITMSGHDLSLYDDSPDRLRQDFTIYYADADRRYLIGQPVSISLEDPSALPRLLLEALLTAPEDGALRTPLPDGTRIRDVQVADGVCTVDVSREFETNRFADIGAQLLSLQSAVCTLTALDSIERVEFSIEGNLMIRYGDLIFTDPLEPDSRFIGPIRTALGETECILYLSHESDGRLVPVPGRIRQSTTISQPELVLRTLLSDGGHNGLDTGIPAGTQLNSILISEGICHVDLSEEYLSQLEQLLRAGRSIAATLCRLDRIHGVCITVNGTVPADVDRSLLSILVPNQDWFL